MKKNLRTIISLAAALGFCFLSFSFTYRFGGDSYTVFINDKQVIQYYVASKQPTPSLKLDAGTLDDQISVYFNECGKIGTARTLILKDGQNKILKEWTYANVTGDHTPMSLTAKEVHALARNGSASLFYQSDTISKGLLIAPITWINKDKASR
jgi:hypothetical protein